MNYRHIYHAGNFADIFKHLILIHLIQYLQIKDTPICILDSHAGIGLYDLLGSAAQKTREYEQGIYKIMQANSPPPLVQKLLALIKHLPENQGLSLPRYYPGSPLIAKSLLREKDRLVLSELHPEDYNTLSQYFYNEKKIHIHHQDAYQTLNAILPPFEKRGLVLIDPPYEDKDEYKLLEQVLLKTLKKWPLGMYAIWYPIKKSHSLPSSLIHKIAPLCKTYLQQEWLLYPEDSPIGLNGSGMLILNPPWNFKETFSDTAAWLEHL